MTDAKGRLCVVRDDAVAVRQLLALVRDIEPGDLRGSPGLGNPCLRIGRGSLKAILDDVARAVRRLLRRVRLDQVTVTAKPAKTEAACLGWLTLRGGAGDARWQVRLQVLRRESGFALRM